MKRYRQASPCSTTSGSVESRCVVPLCLMAIVAGACSVDLSRLRGPASSGRDGAADFPAVSDVAGAGGGEDVIGADSELVSFDLPAVNDVAVLDDATDLPGSVAAEDANVPDDVADSSDLAASGEESGAAPPDIGGGGAGGGGGNGGTGAVDANGGAGGDGGNGGAGAVDANGGASGGTGGTGAADANGGRAGDAGIDSGGGAGGTGGDAGFDGGGGASVDPDLVLWYTFDESSGTTVADSSSSGGGLYDGTLGTAGTGGSATFSTDCQVGTHALSLSDSNRGGGYVTAPAPEALAPGDLTIAVWIKLAAATSAENWERVFDFSSGSTSNAFFYLTARASDVSKIPLRFGISKSGHTTAAEQRLESPSAITANAWHHIAIVLPAGATYTGALYIDGVVVATNSAMTLHLSDVVTTTLNWLGRSPFTNDPFFNGSLDDFRIYKRALSATEISALFLLR